MSQAVTYALCLCTDDIFLLGEYEDINKIANQLNQDFCNICAWCVDNKLIIQFGEDETKCILFQPICFQCTLSLPPENIKTPYTFLVYPGSRERAHWEQIG